MLLAPQRFHERQLPFHEQADLLQRQAEKLQHDDLFEPRQVAVAVQPLVDRPLGFRRPIRS